MFGISIYTAELKHWNRAWPCYFGGQMLYFIFNFLAVFIFISESRNDCQINSHRLDIKCVILINDHKFNAACVYIGLVLNAVKYIIYLITVKHNNKQTMGWVNTFIKHPIVNSTEYVVCNKKSRMKIYVCLH